MVTENPRVWFKSISLENVRSFGTKQTISFTDKNGNAARWNVILGDNGTGKTTVLKGLVGTLDYLIFSSNHIIDSLEREAYKGYNIDYTFEIFDKGLKNDDSYKVSIYGPAVGLKEGRIPVNPLDEPEVKLTLFAYGASRRIGSGALSQTDFFSETDFIIKSFITLFRDDKSLLNAEEWLVQADYISLKEEKFSNQYSKVLKLLKTLFQSEVSDIYIDTKSGIPKVFFKTHYGDVRLHELSLGYKTLIAWMVDFAKGLFDRYPDSENPLAEPAVCLVDEIDLHLHPKFQRNIIQFLTETFPNTQFIVTAHSPLIVVATEERPLDANIILLKREGDQTVVVNDPIDVSTWSVDQILNSDLFGHVQPASEPLNELRTERDTLLAKSKLTKKDQERLAELDNKIGFVPFGRDQTEIKAETIIQQLADVLRSKQSAQ